MAPKNINLRAFSIANDDIAQSNSGLQKILSDKLQGSVLQDRRMLLNQDDCEEDLISDFNNNTNFVYGVILRICPSDTVQNIPNDYLQKEKISITELDSISSEKTNVCKYHYYFALNDKFVVTNLQRNITIDRLQTYINYLLEKERGTRLFEFTPVITEPEETKLSEIKNIVVKDTKIHTDIVSQNNENSIGRKSFNIAKYWLSDFINDVDTLKTIEENQIISAELLIKFSKPRKMSKEDYEKTMGALLKPMSDTDDVTFVTKRGNKIKATDLQKIKSVDIELTDSGKISEIQLQQAMEKFLQELQNEKSSN